MREWACETFYTVCEVAWGGCSGAAIQQLRQPERLQSEERVSSRSAVRKQKASLSMAGDILYFRSPNAVHIEARVT